MSNPRPPSWSATPPDQRPAYAARIAAALPALDDRLAILAVRGPGEAEIEPCAGNLDHLPYVAKDMLATPDHRPGCGFARPPKDIVTGDYATILQRLDASGARRAGFANMTTLAYEPSGYNALRTYPRNPWHLEFATGGSSSGSGVAVSAGASVLAIGSDTGGSVRIPAACTGVTGWKPTLGLIALDGAMALCPSLDTLGLLARDAVDIALAAPLIVTGSRGAPGGRRRDPEASEPGHWPEARLVSMPSRVLVLRDVLAAAEPAVVRACRDALDALETVGPRLERRDGMRVLDVLDPPTLAIMQGEIARTHRRLLESDVFDRETAKRMAKGLAITDEDLAAHRLAHGRRLRDFLEAYLPGDGCVALPAMPIRVPPLAETMPRSPGFSARTLYAMSRNTRFVNYLGLPAVVVPVGFDDRGLPIGLQLVGRPGSDAALLTLAAALQSRTDWHGRVPAAVADLHVVAVPEERSAEL